MLSRCHPQVCSAQYAAVGYRRSICLLTRRPKRRPLSRRGREAPRREPRAPPRGELSQHARGAAAADYREQEKAAAAAEDTSISRPRPHRRPARRIVPRVAVHQGLPRTGRGPDALHLPGGIHRAGVELHYQEPHDGEPHDRQLQ